MAVGAGFDDRNVGLLILYNISSSISGHRTLLASGSATTTQPQHQPKPKASQRSILTDNFIMILTFTFFFCSAGFPSRDYLQPEQGPLRQP